MNCSKLLCVTCAVCRINNCVGEENQFAFLLLLFYTFLLSLTTLVVDFVYFVLLADCITCNKVIFCACLVTVKCSYIS